jgi:hypothetical protein
MPVRLLADSVLAPSALKVPCAIIWWKTMLVLCVGGHVTCMTRRSSCMDVQQ